MSLSSNAGGGGTTSNNVPLVLRLVYESTRVVQTAGEIVRRVVQSGTLDVVDKGINDLQTKADRAAQTYIITELRKRFPLACIIGEEGDDIMECLDGLVSPVIGDGERKEITSHSEILTRSVPETLTSVKEDEVVIWVDPLDGTAEFAKGFVTHVTVLVGIACNGSPIGGVIHQPFLVEGNVTGRTLWGIPGVGFGGFTAKPPPKDKRIITTTTSHSNPRVEAVVNSMKADEVLRVGGAGHKAILLMEGRAHAYVFASRGCKKWDTCAPEAVLTAIGGKLTDMNGEHYVYSKDVQHVNEGGLLATAPGQDHDWYVKQIPKE